MTIMVIFGGVSTEHSISAITAAQAMDAMDGMRIVPVYVGRDGVWRTRKGFVRLAEIRKGGGKKVHLRPASPYLYEGNRKLAKIDCILSCMHGLHGEDGTVAALAETAGIPYACCGIAGSAVGMDKALTKYVLRGLGLPSVPFVDVTRENRAALRETLKERELEFPLVVKPARLGSSIGIAMAHDEAELERALDVAFSYDTRAVVEKGIANRKEYNCAALGRGSDVTIGEIEEVGGFDELLSFTDKYLREGKIKGMDNTARRVPARVSEKLAKEMRAAVRKIFAALDMQGVVRVDFLYDASAKRLYVNEVNVVPGSLAYYLFPDLGMKGVVETAIRDGIASAEARAGLTTEYEREILHAK